MEASLREDFAARNSVLLLFLETARALEPSRFLRVADPAGAEMKSFESLLQSGFVFENPNAQKSCGCGTSFSA